MRKETRGRKPVLPHMKRECVSARIPAWLLDELYKQPESAGIVIEKALCHYLKVSNG